MDKQRTKRLATEERKKELKDQIPAEDRKRLSALIKEYGPYLEYEDIRTAELNAVSRIQYWLNMTIQGREEWFKRAELKAKRRKEVLDEKTAYIQQRRARRFREELKNVDPSWLNEFKAHINSFGK